MTLVVQVCGALLLGALLGVLMLGDSGHQTVAGVTALAVALASPLIIDLRAIGKV